MFEVHGPINAKLLQLFQDNSLVIGLHVSALEDSHDDFNITATGLPAAIHKLVIWKIHTVIYYS